MTRKDYELIAKALKSRMDNALGLSAAYRKTISPAEVVGMVACELADELGQDNPRFDRSRFLMACGVES